MHIVALVLASVQARVTLAFMGVGVLVRCEAGLCARACYVHVCFPFVAYVHKTPHMRACAGARASTSGLLRLGACVEACAHAGIVGLGYAYMHVLASLSRLCSHSRLCVND